MKHGFEIILFHAIKSDELIVVKNIKKKIKIIEKM